MQFDTPAYALFFALVFAGYWLLRRSDQPRVLLLLGASYYFYGFWSWKLLGLILFSTALDYAVGRWMEQTEDARRRKALLIASLVGNLGVLSFFKYWNFFAGELSELLSGFGVAADARVLNLVLPVGISFYTFQTLSYTIDVYRKELSAERNFPRFALFVAFFPQLVAGPIVRAKHFLPQIGKQPALRAEAIERGLLQIFTGLLKKVVIADYIGSALVDPVWSDPSAHGGWVSLLAIYGYAFQIYGDFSGYSDIAIGSAAMLGFDLGENFRSPYRSTRPAEFWTRWHISLSSWLRDYLYIPLGGNRKGPTRTHVNLMLTMLLGGLWHGASWMFVLWGGLHGLYLVVDRLIPSGAPRTALGRFAARVFLFQLTCLAWVVFRSADGGQAAAVLASLAQPAVAALPEYIVPVLILALVMHMPSRRAKERLRSAFVRLPGVVQGVAYALLVGLLMNADSLDVPFIYFQF